MSKISYSPEPPFATGTQPDAATQREMQSFTQRAAQRQHMIADSVSSKQHPVSKKIFQRKPQEFLIRPQTGSPSHCPDSERFSPSADALERMRRLERHQQHEVMIAKKRQHRTQQEHDAALREAAQQQKEEQLLQHKARIAAERAAAEEARGRFNIISLKES